MDFSAKWAPQVISKLLTMDFSVKWAPQVISKLVTMDFSVKWAPLVNGKLVMLDFSVNWAPLVIGTTEFLVKCAPLLNSNTGFLRQLSFRKQFGGLVNHPLMDQRSSGPILLIDGSALLWASPVIYWWISTPLGFTSIVKNLLMGFFAIFLVKNLLGSWLLWCCFWWVLFDPLWWTNNLLWRIGLSSWLL